MLKGGIVGCGLVANVSHLPVFQGLRELQIVALCDPMESVALRTGKRWDIPKTYCDPSRMLHEERLDFVDICSPPQTHSALAIQAMEAGMHVLVEKPMALSVSEADKMISISKKHHVKLCVIHNFLFTPPIQKAKYLVDTGAIGDLITVHIEMLATRRLLSKQDHWAHSLPGGIFSDYAPHAIYLESTFLGNINSVKAIARKHSDFPWVRADEFKVLLEAENGLGGFTISFNSPRYSFTMDIFGTKSILHIDNFSMSTVRHKAGVNRIRDLVVDDLKSSFQLVMGAFSSSLKAVVGQRWYNSGHRVIIQRFIESIRSNIDPPVTGEESRETLRALEDIWKQIGSPTSSRRDNNR